MLFCFVFERVIYQIKIYKSHEHGTGSYWHKVDTPDHSEKRRYKLASLRERLQGGKHLTLQLCQIHVITKGSYVVPPGIKK